MSEYGEDRGEGIAYMIWEKKYVFVKDMLPGFVTEEFGRKVSSRSTFKWEELLLIARVAVSRSSPRERASISFVIAVTTSSGGRYRHNSRRMVKVGSFVAIYFKAGR